MRTCLLSLVLKRLNVLGLQILDKWSRKIAYWYLFCFFLFASGFCLFVSGLTKLFLIFGTKTYIGKPYCGTFWDSNYIPQKQIKFKFVGITLIVQELCSFTTRKKKLFFFFVFVLNFSLPKPNKCYETLKQCLWPKNRFQFEFDGVIWSVLKLWPCTNGNIAEFCFRSLT